MQREPIKYQGYTFHSDGRVFNSSGNKLTPGIDKNGNRSIVLNVASEENPNEKHKRRIYIARTIYNLFHDTILPNNIIIAYKDGDKGNYSVDNLYTVTKRSYQRRVLTNEQVQEIIVLYKNKDHHFHSQWLKKEGDYSIRDLASKYNVSIYTIQRVIHGRFECTKEETLCD